MSFYFASGFIGVGSSVLFFLGFLAGSKAAAAAAAAAAAETTEVAAVATATATAAAEAAAVLSGYGILLALLGVVVGGIISSESNNPIQDWLERCIFHKEPDPKDNRKKPEYYPDMYIESYNLKMATAG